MRMQDDDSHLFGMNTREIEKGSRFQRGGSRVEGLKTSANDCVAPLVVTT